MVVTYMMLRDNNPTELGSATAAAAASSGGGYNLSLQAEYPSMGDELHQLISFDSLVVPGGTVAVVPQSSAETGGPGAGVAVTLGGGAMTTSDRLIRRCCLLAPGSASNGSPLNTPGPMSVSVADELTTFDFDRSDLMEALPISGKRFYGLVMQMHQRMIKFKQNVSSFQSIPS